MAIRCGTCAWADHHQFYPRSIKPADRLSYYARYFSLVEIDSSFYRIPELDHVRHWIAQTPNEFVFDLKAYRTLTGHDRGQVSEDDRARHRAEFTEVAGVLHDAGRLGQVLFQFPPWFERSEVHRLQVDEMVSAFQGMRIGIEFRNRTWWEGRAAAETLTWLRQQRYVNVVCDEPQSGIGTIPFVPEITQSELVVFRLHGRNADTWYEKGLTSSQQRFDYLYEASELTTFLPYVEQWSRDAAEVHILMNNNQADYAIRNAVDWMDLLLQDGPRPTRMPQIQQLSLFDDKELRT